MEFLELAKNRYSCRNLTDKPVEAEKVNKILEAAVVAPTACNKQPFKIWVIEKDEDIEKIKLATKFTFGAKLFFVIGAKQDEGWVRKFDGREFASVDASIVATHIMMEVEALGLGTTWVGYFNNIELINQFPVMDGYDLIAIFPVGYPEEDAKPMDMHFKRKSADELVERL